MTGSALPPPNSPSSAREYYVQCFGAIKMLRIPPGWRALDGTASHRSASVCIQIYPANITDVTVKIALREKRLSAHGCAAWCSVVNRKSGEGRAEILLPSEIRALGELLGAASNNQYQFADHYAFKMSNAASVMIKGKTLTEIYGTFVDSQRRPISDCLAYFWVCPQSGIVQELILQGHSVNLALIKRTFKQFINSIDWL
jgi:hypothetical protein